MALASEVSKMLANGSSAPPASEPRPAAAGDAPVAVSAEPVANASAIHVAMPQGVRVLVVDDDPRVRRIVVGSLVRVGFHVVAADDGTPAIAAAESSAPDVAVVDLGMPTSGYQVVRRLKELYGAAVHVAVLSGRDDEDTRLAAFDCGADDFLVKPLSVAELRRRVMAAARTQQAFIDARLARERADRLLAYSAEAAALLAHDLNNGLQVALSNITYLSQVIDVGDDEKQAMESTLRALRRMSGLVANFVDIARFEDAAVKPRAAPTQVRDMLLDVMSVHSPSLSRGVRHVVACEPDLVGHFDHALIERVLHNLVGNAVRYCNPGGVIRLTGKPWERPGEPNGVEILVQNSGPHIPDDLRQSLFGKYQRGSNGKRGMGLYFCRLAADAHGGTIEHEATAEGPQFRIRLPSAPGTG
jgi:two-component system sensor histidine kinase/response regulator